MHELHPLESACITPAEVEPFGIGVRIAVHSRR